MTMRRKTRGTGSLFGNVRAMLLIGLLAFLAASATPGAATDLAAFAAATVLLMAALGAWGRFGLWRLDVRPECDSVRLYSGEALTLKVGITNRKALPVRVRVEMDRPETLMPDSGPDLAGGIAGEASLPPFGRTTESWTLRALRRGLHRVGPVKVFAGDVFGLADRSRVVPFSHEIVVFPRLAPLITPELPFSDYFGINRVKGLIEDTAWYEGTREYRGDKPAKHIHWKASARLGTLQEKVFEPTAHQKVFFLFDGAEFAGEADAALFERALEILAALASRYAEAGASIAIATDRAVSGFPAVLPLGRGPEHLGSLLELLARCVNRKGQSLMPLVLSAGSGGALFIVLCRAGGGTTAKYSALPARTRDRIFFIFAETASAGEEGGTGGFGEFSWTDFGRLCPGGNE